MSLPERTERRKRKRRNPMYLAITNGESVPQKGLHFPDVTGMTLLEAALAYAEAGWFVLPVKSGTKNPGSVVGGRWQELSSRDPEQIREWWSENSNHGIALHCGRSGAGVFDYDMNNLDALRVMGRGDLADALLSAEAVQGTRGEGDRGHYIFLLPDDGKEYGNSAGAFTVVGEFRGKNGVIIAAPTPHPDAETKGGEYRQVRTGPVGRMPDVLRECLSEAGASADPLTDAETEALLDTHTARGECGREGCRHGVEGPVKQFRERIANGESRHDSLVRVAPWAFAEAMAGCYPAGELFGTLHSAYAAEFSADDEPERVAQLSDEYVRVVRWAMAVAQADPDRAHRNDDLPTDAELEAFWSARDILRHIYASSLAQQMDPRGVLAVHLVRAICSIPPYVTLPGTTAARASLNLHVALVGPSSGGKSSSVGVAKAAVAVTPEPEVTTLGSAEGIAKQYAYRDTKTKTIVTVTDTLLFNDTEIESVEALSKRSGNPLMSQWRKTFTGEQLGFGYADPKHRIPVRAHKYRFCQVLGIQPELAGWLLNGTQAAAGTPQRILWAPVVYSQMPRPEDLPAWPGQKVLQEWPMPVDERSTDTSGTRTKWPNLKAVDRDANENMLREHELGVPGAVGALIREARYRFHHGEVDSFGGHSTLTRLKVAAGLMWLDGRTDKVTEEDWDLAGVVMRVSNSTRASVQNALATEARDTNRRRGHAEAEREDAKEDYKYDKTIARVSERIREKLRGNNGQAKARLRRQFGRDKEYVDEALARLIAVGDVELEPIEGTGNPGHRVWLKAGR
ncbi:bifunctional DNA primase/polymerase [Mycolicibacterium alvei]|uniref:DNA primase/polymerase bifunctional N-terminal domain-containing protein n=1 Tax=Mycolicibacterium alvei TaxID=67081 RepID=A0A6N4USU0_9MYCO|nr:bifunctional DNA primase/polymerase [Mycolicibacterium alvei]MCV7002109.1 bifunctional DNA primase/polymerase [Mycolicibacterium alvei]BBX27950.1 hypothetical protein MALV_30750 [Mycolicibacterium alvei]